jgi:hypothetical protein
MVSAAANITDDPLGELGFALPADIVSLAPEVRAVELRRIADLLNTAADKIDGGFMTTQQAAEACGRSEENLRQWCRRFGIGHFDNTSHRYQVSKSKLTAHLLATFGRLPHGLAGK